MCGSPALGCGFAEACGARSGASSAPDGRPDAADAPNAPVATDAAGADLAATTDGLGLRWLRSRRALAATTPLVLVEVPSLGETASVDDGSAVSAG